MSDGKFKPGNRAAEKYSVEDAVTIFRAILYYFQHQPHAFFINQACNYLGYYGMLPYYLMEKYGDNMEIAELAWRISSLCEERVVVGGATGGLEKTMAIFILKCKQNWKEARDNQVQDQPKIQNNTYNIANLPPEKLKELREVRQRLEQLTQGGGADEE